MGRGTGLVTGDAQLILASLGRSSREEGDGHAWLMCVRRDVGNDIGFGIECAGAHVSTLIKKWPFLEQVYSMHIICQCMDRKKDCADLLMHGQEVGDFFSPSKSVFFLR